MRQACIVIVMVLLSSACAHKQVPHASHSAGEFELIAASNGLIWSVLRYQPSTGETWVHLPYYWHTINEMRPPGLSQYLVRMIGFGGSNWVAIRIDRRSGRCWRIIDSTWKEITWNLPTKSSDGAYNIEIVSTGNGWELIRYDQHSGESWQYLENSWQLLQEKKKPDKSEYVVRMAGENGWFASRLDTISGKFWILDTVDNTHLWVEMDMAVKPENRKDEKRND